MLDKNQSNLLMCFYSCRFHTLQRGWIWIFAACGCAQIANCCDLQWHFLLVIMHSTNTIGIDQKNKLEPKKWDHFIRIVVTPVAWVPTSESCIDVCMEKVLSQVHILSLTNFWCWNSFNQRQFFGCACDNSKNFRKKNINSLRTHNIYKTNSFML